MALPPPAPDRTCLVTGASSGIGADLARQLVRRGHGVTLVARREDRLRTLAGELADHGVRAEVLAADLTDPEARHGLGARVAEAGLTIDVLVNNAGFSTAGPVARADRDRELGLVRTDIEAVVDLCTLLVPGMVERGRGAVLNVASTAGFQPIPGQAAYAAAKSFVLSYTQSLTEELRGSGVTVTALCPGPVHTEFLEVAGLDRNEVTAVMPKATWIPSDRVAREAVDGLASGAGVVVPGLVNRAISIGAHHTPRRLLVPLLARFSPSMKA